MNIDFQKLRVANVARQVEWTGNEQADIAFRALEVADEAGEIAGAVKKLLRAQRGICGSTKSIEDVADELGDTVIALDLLANEFGVDLPPPASAHIFAGSEPIELALAIDAAIGNLVQGVLGFLDRVGRIPDDDEAGGYITSRMQTALRLLIGLSEALGIDAGRAVAVKFNKTSAKYRLSTRMEV
ncbi:MazG-like family protein [Pukyongiella litopenaei]|uniref:NTP pyrophosphohydrolase MazG putative catalytic core domain-containing protein n=1 Tax=Pukyongiella litopenaei TaxID=2605946 RepID=A0A2S0MNF9_9RHOB|nr:MazG-like family protein [Pukyongiella litopenaei]AVO37376.1 hypothetical protein C6Y53_06400 [Pukyongiella litopenaei]